MSDQYVPALRQRFPEDMQIKGCSPRRSRCICAGCGISAGFRGTLPIRRRLKSCGRFSLI